ncbi:hypothetical protein BD413DRAFT_634063 [Trametes elegans]|nr:hypothetical protein BD413DRAFT_634063 [Trametes elegans]
MTEEAAQLAREAKSLQHTLRESLKTKEPWDRETDFTRKQLRRDCLRLLLLHPYAPESKDAETVLWIHTSYTFISHYKQRISTLDRAIHGGSRPQPQQGQGQGQQGAQAQPRQHSGHGIVEYRKLLQRFRQFLADEEKFWIQLIVRIRRIFQLDDAQPLLAELGLLPPDEEPPAPDGPPRRNHFQFPSDADVAAAASTLTLETREQRESRMAILSKALVCLGDIERYKEQYNESGGRPRAGHEDGPPAVLPNGQKGGRGRKPTAPPPPNGAPLLARMRDYHKAQQCYQQARLLVPQDGNPAHQMAILASYQKDTFGSLVHYYRALCVRSPYDTAADNLGTVLSKALEAWRSRGSKKEREREKELARGEIPSRAPRLRVEAFKEKLIVLHALWRFPPEEAEAIAPNLAQKVAEDFRALVSERVLPLDIILRVVVLSQGALWKHRMFRNSSGGGQKKNTSASSAAAVENAIAAHLLAIHRVLLEVGIVQISEATSEDAAEHDLAQHITAEFRRTLPALRIASKWLRANLRYLAQAWQQRAGNGNGVATDTEATTARPKGRDRRRGSDRRSGSASSTPGISGISDFWQMFAQFSTILWRAFPQDKLPKLATTLEEDVELAGFLPLKKFIPSEVIGVLKESGKDGRSGTMSPGFQVVQPEQVHPNEEQLMRIADLLVDAQALARDEICPLSVSDGRFFVEDVLDAPAPNRRPSAPQTPRQPLPPPQSAFPMERFPQGPPKGPSRLTAHLTSEPRNIDREDDSMTDITRTDDDPVDAAFRKALGPPTEAGEDDEEDEIVWSPGSVYVSASCGPMLILVCSSPVAPIAPAPPPQPVVFDPAVVSAVPANINLPAPAPPQSFVASPPVPALSPRSPPSHSPSFTPKRSVETTPSLGLVPPPNVTTAQDLLANVLHRSPPKGDMGRPLHTRQASAPPTHMLFGSNPLGGGPSIWSSDETDGLGFQGAAGTSSGPSYSSYNLQSQTQASHPPAYPLQSSVSLGQLAHPLGSTRASFGGLSPPGYAHQRVQSLSVGRSQMAPAGHSQSSQFFLSSQSQSQSQSPRPFASSQGQPPFADGFGFGSYPALAEQSAVAYSSRVPAAYADPVYSHSHSHSLAPARKLEAGYLRQDPPGYPVRPVPYPIGARASGQPDAYPPLPSMAQLWNNPG